MLVDAESDEVYMAGANLRDSSLLLVEILRISVANDRSH